MASSTSSTPWCCRTEDPASAGAKPRATGLIGKELGKSLAARGDTLVCPVRNARGARHRLPFPATCFEWDHQRAVPAEALFGADAIVHLSGEPVAEKRWTNEQKRSILDTRVFGTRRLVQAALNHGPNIKSSVHGSTIGFCGDRADATLTAASAKGAGFLADVVQAWQAELRPLTERRPDVDAAIVRTGPGDGGCVLPPSCSISASEVFRTPGARGAGTSASRQRNEARPIRRRFLYMHGHDEGRDRCDHHPIKEAVRPLRSLSESASADASATRLPHHTSAPRRRPPLDGV